MYHLKSLSVSKFLAVTTSALLFMSCNKENIINGYLPPLPLPDSVAVTYGDTVSYQLPEEYAGADVSLEISVDHPGQQVDQEHSLLDLVKKSVHFDQKNARILIYSSQLYPNNMFSSTFQNTIPSSYPIVITSKTKSGLKGVSKKIRLAVHPAKLYLKNESNKELILTPYSLYNDPQKTFDLVLDNFNMEGSTFQFDPSYGNKDSYINIVNNQIVIDQNAGDPNKKKEWVYTLRPLLLKNGYKIAEREMKLSILPAPKLFYGIYYQDFDLTVIYNRFVIPLGNSFTSDAPIVNPSRFKGKFRIKSIQLHEKSFNDVDAVFSIDASSGVIKVKKNGSLNEGEYKLVIENESADGRLLTTDFALVMQYLSGE